MKRVRNVLDFAVYSQELLPESDNLTPLDVSAKLFPGIRGLANCSEDFGGYICGLQKLCHRLGIEPTMVTYRSLMAALVQLGLYSKEFGRFTSTLLFRPAKHFHFVVGATIISEVPHGASFLSVMRKQLIEQGMELNKRVSESRGRNRAKTLKGGLVVSATDEVAPIPERVVRHLANALAERWRAGALWSGPS